MPHGNNQALPQHINGMGQVFNLINAIALNIDPLAKISFCNTFRLGRQISHSTDQAKLRIEKVHEKGKSHQSYRHWIRERSDHLRKKDIR